MGRNGSLDTANKGAGIFKFNTGKGSLRSSVRYRPHALLREHWSPTVGAKQTDFINQVHLSMCNDSDQHGVAVRNITEVGSDGEVPLASLTSGTTVR